MAYVIDPITGEMTWQADEGAVLFPHSATGVIHPQSSSSYADLASNITPTAPNTSGSTTNYADLARSIQGLGNRVSAGGGGDATSSTIGGALSGAGTGAAIGSVVPGIGTAIGAGVGGLIGGVGSYLEAGDKQKAIDADLARQNEEKQYQRDQVSKLFDYTKSQDRLAQANKTRQMNQGTLNGLGDFYARTHYMG